MGQDAISQLSEPHLSQNGPQPCMEGLRSLQLKDEAGCCNEVAVQGMAQISDLVCKARHRLHQGIVSTFHSLPMYLDLKVEKVRNEDVKWSSFKYCRWIRFNGTRSNTCTLGWRVELAAYLTAPAVLHF